MPRNGLGMEPGGIMRDILRVVGVGVVEGKVTDEVVEIRGELTDRIEFDSQGRNDRGSSRS
jgi:hypothetical protein